MQTNNFHFVSFFVTHVGVNLPSMATYSTFPLTLSFPLQKCIFSCTKPVTVDPTINVNIVQLYRLDTFLDANLSILKVYLPFVYTVSEKDCTLFLFFFSRCPECGEWCKLH